MSDNSFEAFSDKEKALHQALWLSFKNRVTKTEFGVVPYKNDTWAVIERGLAEDLGFTCEVMPDDYSNMEYDMIRKLRSDDDPPPPWEELMGTFSVLNGEILRYILHAKIPLEKLIRYELAGRGYDKDHVWTGFDKAEEIWLKE